MVCKNKKKKRKRKKGYFLLCILFKKLLFLLMRDANVFVRSFLNLIDYITNWGLQPQKAEER